MMIFAFLLSSLPLHTSWSISLGTIHRVITSLGVHSFPTNLHAVQLRSIQSVRRFASVFLVSFDSSVSMVTHLSLVYPPVL